MRFQSTWRSLLQYNYSVPAGSGSCCSPDAGASACPGCSAAVSASPPPPDTSQLIGARAARAAVSNGVSAESQLLDPELLQLLRGVQAGEVSPEAATLQLRERTAGYEQARSCHKPQP